MIAYCFLTKVEPALSHFWKQWLGDAPVFVHAKLPDSLSDWWRDRLIAKYVPTRWAHISLVRAELALFTEAFSNPAIDRIVLLSGQCFPNYSRKEVEAEIEEQGESSLLWRMHKSTERIPYVPRGYPWTKASQWLSLSRRDWESAFAHDDTASFEWSRMKFVDEHYFAMRLERFGQGWKHFPLTWANWPPYHSESPDEIRELTGDESAALFVRKVTNATHLHENFLARLKVKP